MDNFDELDFNFDINLDLDSDNFAKLVDDEFDDISDSISLETDSGLGIEDIEIDPTLLEKLATIDDFLEDSDEFDEPFAENNNALVVSEKTNTNIILRRPLSMMDTLDQYEPMFVRLATLVKDYDFQKKASDEIGKRLIQVIYRKITLITLFNLRLMVYLVHTLQSPLLQLQNLILLGLLT